MTSLVLSTKDTKAPKGTSQEECPLHRQDALRRTMETEP